MTASDITIKKCLNRDPEYVGCNLLDFVCIKTGNVYTFFSSKFGRFFATTKEARDAYFSEQEIEIEDEEPKIEI